MGRGSARIWVLLYEDFALASRNFAAKRGKEGKISAPARRQKGTWKDGGDVGKKQDGNLGLEHLTGKVAQYYGLEESDIQIQWKND